MADQPFDPFADLRPAIAARVSEKEREEIRRAADIKALNELAKKVMDDLGLKPKTIYDGGYCRFNMAEFQVTPGGIYRVEFCTTCNRRRSTLLPVPPTLENIGKLLENAYFHPHPSCLEGNHYFKPLDIQELHPK